jgi:tripartite-type tricarboxylate transporter receptor subunit TctC
MPSGIGLFKKLILSIFVAFISSAALAWEPSKPINVIIGFAPGSGNEVSFRGVSSILEKENSKINFIIENRPGADGVVAMNEFIRKPNDGYHVYIPSHQGIWVTAEYFNKQAVRYTLDDFDYVVTIAKSPLAVIVNADSDVRSIPQMIEKIKNTSRPINFAAGSGAHKLAFTYMASKLSLNTDIVKTIGYKGPAQAAQDVAGGHTEFGIVPTAIASAVAYSGKIRILGICSEKPVTGIDAPLMNKWVPGMNVYAAWSIILPKNTPENIKKWYIDNFSRVIRSPEAKQFFDRNFMFVEEKELNPEGFKSSMMKLREQWIPFLINFKED